MKTKPFSNSLYRRPRLTQEEKKEIWKLYNEGVSGGSIAIKLCRGRTTIHRMLKSWEESKIKPF